MANAENTNTIGPAQGGMRHISEIARPMIADVLMRHISERDAVNNREAAHNAAGCGISFMAHDQCPHLCDIVCPTCEKGWVDTLTSYYSKYPFGCPSCGPVEKRDMWQARAGHEFRTKTPEAVQADMVPKVRRVVYSMPEDERGPLFGRLKRIQRDGATLEDFRWMREMLAPDAELIE